MNKNEWLTEAKQYIDSLSAKEFEDFLISCDPSQVTITEYSITDVRIGKAIDLSKLKSFASDAANSDYNDCIDRVIAA